MSNAPTTNLPGVHELVTLSDGECHFRHRGHRGQPTVVMLHGATVPGWEFDRIIPYFCDAGLRTICPDLFGHGYSSRPRVAHDYALFERQVTELLDAPGIDAPITLLGHSLGAALAARIAVENPARIRRLVLVAPLLDFLATRPSACLLRVPVLGELLVRGYVVPMLLRRRSERYAPIEDGRFVGMFRDQLRLPGFGRSLLSLVRSGTLGSQRSVYASLATTGIPVMTLRGSEDLIFSTDHFRELRRLLPGAVHREFPCLGHPLLLTHPEVVAPVIRAFLAGTGAHSFGTIGNAANNKDQAWPTRPRASTSSR